MKILVIISSFILISLSVIGQGKKDNWKSFPANSDSLQEIPMPKSELNFDDYEMEPVKIGSAVSNSNEQIKEADALYLEQSKANPTIKGYTVLVFSGSGANSKLKARNSLIEFENLYPECTTHLAWKSPNYELRVGDFRTKLEAEKLLITIKIDFPAAFVKSSIIDLPAIENDNVKSEN